MQNDLLSQEAIPTTVEPVQSEVASFEDMAKGIENKAKLADMALSTIMRNSNPLDWVRFGENYYLSGAGVERFLKYGFKVYGVSRNKR